MVVFFFCFRKRPRLISLPWFIGQVAPCPDRLRWLPAFHSGLPVVTPVCFPFHNTSCFGPFRRSIDRLVYSIGWFSTLPTDLLAKLLPMRNREMEGTIRRNYVCAHIVQTNKEFTQNSRKQNGHTSLNLGAQRNQLATSHAGEARRTRCVHVESGNRTVNNQTNSRIKIIQEVCPYL